MKDRQMKAMIMNDVSEKTELIRYLSGFITERRYRLFHEVVANRTRYVSIVLEDIYQPHNASAVLRSCDCFGVQDVHIIENNNVYEVNPDVALGSAQWLSIHKYNSAPDNTEVCLKELKKAGYRIVATTPHANASLLPDFDVSAGKFALLFGTEKNGLSQKALELAEEYVKIPMVGFTESFNISVSAALCLFHLTSEVRNHVTGWRLAENEIHEVLLEWLRISIRESAGIEKNFLSKK